jgi:hypothetical protein
VPEVQPPVCHFCEGDADTFTIHECPDFVDDGVTFTGPWRACPTCDALIAAGNGTGLLARALELRENSVTVQNEIVGFWARRR